MQEEGSLPGMQWRAPQAVCTSAARKIRVPLVARQRQSLSAGLVPCFARSAWMLCSRGEQSSVEIKEVSSLGHKMRAVVGKTGSKLKCGPTQSESLFHRTHAPAAGGQVAARYGMDL